MDDQGIIKIPRQHIWVECENPAERRDDSLTELGGPISKKYVVGEVTRVIWPLWNMSSMKDLEKFNQRSAHSKTYTNQEIYRKYG